MADKKAKAVGWGKIVSSWKRGVSVCIEDMQEYATKAKNGKSYVNLNIVDLKETNQFGKNVVAEINDWKPKREENRYPKPPENFVDDSGDLGIPF